MGRPPQRPGVRRDNPGPRGRGGAAGIAGPRRPCPYQAKQRGGQGIDVYDETLQQRLAERDQIERDLREELSQGGGGLVLHYQPLVDTAGAMLGVEALVRWARLGHGLLAPDRFIPIAEGSDLIIDLDRWVLAAAARQVSAWSSDPQLAGLRVSVNISGRHLVSQRLPGFLGEVLTATRSTRTSSPSRSPRPCSSTTWQRWPPSSTRCAGSAPGRRGRFRDRLHLPGAPALPAGRHHQDRPELHRRMRDPKDASLVRMIMELAHQLGLNTVSEGVETIEQLKALQALGADHIQGFFIARPMPLQGLQSWARDRLVATEVPLRSPPVSHQPARTAKRGVTPRRRSRGETSAWRVAHSTSRKRSSRAGPHVDDSTNVTRRSGVAPVPKGSRARTGGVVLGVVVGARPRRRRSKWWPVLRSRSVCPPGAPHRPSRSRSRPVGAASCQASRASPGAGESREGGALLRHRSCPEVGRRRPLQQCARPGRRLGPSPPAAPASRVPGPPLLPCNPAGQQDAEEPRTRPDVEHLRRRWWKEPPQGRAPCRLLGRGPGMVGRRAVIGLGVHVPVRAERLGNVVHRHCSPPLPAQLSGAFASRPTMSLPARANPAGNRLGRHGVGLSWRQRGAVDIPRRCLAIFLSTALLALVPGGGTVAPPAGFVPAQLVPIPGVPDVLVVGTVPCGARSCVHCGGSASAATSWLASPPRPALVGPVPGR